MRALISFHKTGNDTWLRLPEKLSERGITTCLIVGGMEEPTLQNVLSEEFLPNFTIPDFWAEMTISSDAVKQYQLFESSAAFSSVLGTLHTMQNRRDFTGTFRQLERDLRLRRIFLVIFTAVLRQAPDFAVFDVTPHDHVNYALASILDFLQIPILFFQPSLVGPQAVPRVSLDEQFKYEISRSIRTDFSEELETVSELSGAAIDRLESGGGTPKMTSQHNREKRAHSASGRIRGVLFFVSRIGRGLHFPSANFTGHSKIPRFLRRFMELVLDWSLRRTLADRIRRLPSTGDDPDQKFALFALHYEPERCSIPEGYPFTSQLDAVLAARALLPEDTHLYVKEHFSQMASALRGSLGRSPEYYDLLSSLPGVSVLGVGAKTKDLIAKAVCVFTLTGKVGIESALVGTPVIICGQPWWKGLPGTVSIEDVAPGPRLESALQAATAPHAEVRTWLETQFREALLPVLGDSTVQRYEERISKLPLRFTDLQESVIVDVIVGFSSSVGRS